MSFATAIALSVGLLVAIPALAHLLRKGKTQEFAFPPAAWVPQSVVTSEQRRRLEDKALLALRGLMVLALAVLGATPFVQCSRLSVQREGGASVAMVLVLDDSQSMRAKIKGEQSRFKLAKQGAQQLLDSAKEGDAIAIVLAGEPVRLALSPTTDLSAARQALTRLRVSDRATAVPEAVAMARSTLTELPHSDQRVVLLSDLAVSSWPSGTPEVWLPLPELREDASNCGIARAERQGQNVVVTVGCNHVDATKTRQLELFVAAEPNSEALNSAPLEAVPGKQRISISSTELGIDLGVRLSGSDALAEDNQAPIAEETTGLSVAVLADPAKASAVTGGPTLIEQALEALAPELRLRPLSSVPESAKDLEGIAALIADDPPGLSPEARAALDRWLQRGGVALGLLGPASAAAQLASSLEPFARKGASWEKNPDVEMDPKSLAWLGPSGASLRVVDSQGRLRLDSANLPGGEIVGTWTDGVPWLLRRQTGHGLVITAGLPVSLTESDLSLRPGFLALLAHVLQESRNRSGSGAGQAGTPWLFSAERELSVQGPQGESVPVQKHQRDGRKSLRVVPEIAGRYTITETTAAESSVAEVRTLGVAVRELTRTPIAANSETAATNNTASDNQVDASPEWALLVLLLFAGELALRLYKPKTPQAEATATSAA